MYSTFLLLLLPSIVNAFYNARLESIFDLNKCLYGANFGTELQLTSCDPAPLNLYNWEFDASAPFTDLRWQPNNNCVLGWCGEHAVTFVLADGPGYQIMNNGQCLGVQNNEIAPVSCNVNDINSNAEQGLWSIVTA